MTDRTTDREDLASHGRLHQAGVDAPTVPDPAAPQQPVGTRPPGFDGGSTAPSDLLRERGGGVTTSQPATVVPDEDKAEADEVNANGPAEVTEPMERAYGDGNQ